MAKVLGLVTARGGSKGIPRKNLRPVAARPLIAWTLDAAKASRLLTSVLVSTDDPEIALAARAEGVDAPFLRPAEYAGDESPHFEVACHALDWLAANRSESVDYVCLLQPTSPLRTAIDIDGAIELALARHADAVVGVTLSPVHPQLMYRMDGQAALTPLLQPEQGYARRQDLPPVYMLNGAIYVNRVEALRHDRTFTPPGALGFVMPAERSLDIDCEAELQAAEVALARINASRKDRRDESATPR